MGVYNIGTKDGYDISESLKKHQGTSTTVSDGSSWTADRDGNIWVTKDGVTTKANITYQPGGSGGAGGYVSGGRRPGISNTGGSGATNPPAGRSRPGAALPEPGQVLAEVQPALGQAKRSTTRQARGKHMIS